MDAQETERAAFECWYQSTHRDVYMKYRKIWMEKIQQFFVSTSNLKTNFPTKKSLQKDVEHIVRQSFVVPISQDRFKTLVGKSTIAKFCQSCTDPFLWGGQPSMAASFIPVVADRIALSLISTEMKQLQEKRQTDAVVAQLQSMGFKEYTTATKKSFDPKRLPVGHYQPQFQVKHGATQLMIDVAVRTKTGFYFIELKSASDEANTSKRWKEEGERYSKAIQLTKKFGIATWQVIVVLTGYFRAAALEAFENEKCNAKCLWFHTAEESLETLIGRAKSA